MSQQFLSYGTTFNFEFFQLPENYSFARAAWHQQ